MRWRIINLDVDGSVPVQPSLFERIEFRLDLRAFEQRLRIWPDKQALSFARAAIEQLRSRYPEPWLVFYGSGDLNHLSAVLVETLPTSSKPVTLVLFDNHPDWFDLPPRYHCGNWVATVLKLPWVDSVILIGQDSTDLCARNFLFAPVREIFKGRVKVFPYSREHAYLLLRRPPEGARGAIKTAWGTKLSFESITRYGAQHLAERLSHSLSGKNVYLAFDKDVLGPEHAATDWDQGRLTRDELMTITTAILRSARVVGADICGERAPNPLKGVLKRLDAGRLPTGTGQRPYADCQQVNETTNLALLAVLTQPLNEPLDELVPSCML